MKKILSVLLVFVILASLFTGCKKETETTYGEGGTPANLLADSVSDSSELPDWTGKKLDVTMWHGSGASNPKRGKKATEDVVTPEIYRVTGVRLASDSYDNGDESMDAKLAKLAASNKWPELLEAPESSVLERLIEKDLIWDLTEYIPKYMPHLQALIDRGGDTPFFKSPREDGKIYWFQMSPNFTYRYPDMDAETRSRVESISSPYTAIYVRDDILKKIKPDAYTQDELDEIFKKKGSFTEEEILNAAFESEEEFYDFLYEVKKLGIKTEKREVYPTYAADGTDNWMLMAVLMGALDGRYSGGYGGADYFTYYDKDTKSVEYMFKQEGFKEQVRKWAQMVNEDVVSLDSLLDTRAGFEEKVASGQYAVLYGSNIPGIKTINDQGNPYKYRKVYIKIPFEGDKYVAGGGAANGYTYAVMKPNVSEEDLIQILQYFDFMMTDVGSKLAYWGPRSAGLFTEDKDGNRTYVDKELEECMLYDVQNDKDLYYGLNNKQHPGYQHGTTKWHPKMTCELDPARIPFDKRFNPGLYKEVKKDVLQRDSITIFNKYSLEGVNKFWNARTAFENALTKTLTAKNDKEFEKLYDKVIETAENNGLTDKYLKELTDVYVNQINADYKEYFK